MANQIKRTTDMPELEVSAEWQTRARGSDANEYDIYLACADDGTGHEIGSGRPLKTFDEWLAS